MGTLENLQKLPEICYAEMPSTKEIIGIRRGEPGYIKIFKTPWDSVEEANKILGVNKAQAEAMLVGSMFGWHVPGANADMYDPETGKPRKGGK